MKRISRSPVIVSLAMTATAALAQPQGPAAAPGDTGASHPEDVIAARRELMLELQTLMWPIDSSAAEEAVDPAPLRDAARTMAAMLGVVPHLFPLSTNRYDPDVDSPETLALPAIWSDFQGFYSLAAGATAAAAKMAEMEGAADLLAAGRALRGTCDACHGVYMREYTGMEVSSDDLEFDFDSLFEPPLE